MTAVLLVDDNVALAENLGEVLVDAGAEVRVAAGGEEALALLEERAFDLVVTDMRMPGMDGLEVLRRIHARWPGIPVIVMTSYAHDSVVDQVQAEGALGVLPKPVDLGLLMNVVARFAPPSSPVLLVEDEPDLRVNLAEALWEDAGVVPVAVGNVAKAQRAVHEVDFPVAIIDVRLPDGDGIEVGRLLLEGNDSCRIIYITGHGQELEDVLARVLEMPGVRLLEKPFSPEKLLELVREAV